RQRDQCRRRPEDEPRAHALHGPREEQRPEVGGEAAQRKRERAGPHAAGEDPAGTEAVPEESAQHRENAEPAAVAHDAQGDAGGSAAEGGGDRGEGDVERRIQGADEGAETGEPDGGGQGASTLIEESTMWKRVCDRGAVPDGGMKQFELDTGLPILIVNAGG